MLAISLLTLLLVGSALAKTPYTLQTTTEGDPGDGVLSPRAFDSPPFVGPETGYEYSTSGSVAELPVPATPTPRRTYRLPTSLYIPGLGWSVLTPLWLLGEGRWTHAP
ncbi:hypothetical protein DRQ50_12695 [bacterium]|nr:MAG: hypothetical protein DRQ50_12695 [bacterium]